MQPCLLVACPSKQAVSPLVLALQVVTEQLEALCRIVLASKPTKGTCGFVDLDKEEGIPIMPTLSGWLLQYPVVYLADITNAEMLASLLSDAVLLLYEVQIAGALVQVIKQHVW